MAHDCCEDAEVAAVMNRLFVNIKVDREEPRGQVLRVDAGSGARAAQRRGICGGCAGVWLRPAAEFRECGLESHPRTPIGRK